MNKLVKFIDFFNVSLYSYPAVIGNGYVNFCQNLALINGLNNLKVVLIQNVGCIIKNDLRFFLYLILISTTNVVLTFCLIFYMLYEAKQKQAYFERRNKSARKPKCNP
jgi:hypothetical protein